MRSLGSLEMFVLLLLGGLLIWSIIWVYGDAERRGKPGILVAILVFLAGWPIGLIFWLVLRPKLMGQDRDIMDS